MRAISIETYKYYMKKYKLKLSVVIDGKRRKKTMKQMSSKIYNHETYNESIKKGLYYI